MEKISRKSFVLGAAGALGLGLLTGCGGSEAASSSAASSEAAAPQKELTFADTIRWGLGASGMVAAKTAADNGA